MPSRTPLTNSQTDHLLMVPGVVGQGASEQRKPQFRAEIDQLHQRVWDCLRDWAVRCITMGMIRCSISPASRSAADL